MQHTSRQHADLAMIAMAAADKHTHTQCAMHLTKTFASRRTALPGTQHLTRQLTYRNLFR